MKLPPNVLRLYRGVSYLLEYLFFELPRGLDLSLRRKSMGITLPGSHGYALTSRAALKNILHGMDLRNRSLLDIGSGKGGVIIFAQQLGCIKTAGIEYEQSLHDIAVRNINKLKLSQACVSYNMDARMFLDYEAYDIFFMFNPFDDEIYAQVIERIKSQIQGCSSLKTRWLICYGGANIEAVINSGLFSLVREDFCPYRGNKFRIFKSRVYV